MERSNRRIIYSFFIFILCVVFVFSKTHEEWIYEDVTYIPLTEFKSGKNIWGSVGINPDGLIMVGVANHEDNVGLYLFNTKNDSLSYEGDFMSLTRAYPTEWQSKIHSYIFWNRKHEKFFFGTDAGSYRSETLVEHPYGYSGGHWCSYDPASKRLEDLGLNAPHRSIKGIAHSEASQMLFGVTDPQTHFITYNITTGEKRDFGRTNGFHQPRLLFCDKWGNAYTTDTQGELLKFDVKSKELVSLRLPLPRAGEQDYIKKASGFMSIQEMPDGSVLGITHWSVAFKYVPAETGKGLMEDLGCVIGRDGKDFKQQQAPNVAVIGDKMYYGMGGHGIFLDTLKKDVVLVEKDLKTKKTRIIHRLDHRRVTELTGSGIIDAAGNIYFGGHGSSLAPEDIEKIAGKDVDTPPQAFLVKFNPRVIAEKYAERYKNTLKN